MYPSPSIVIIGAGPSGLLFARLLEVNGFKNYVIYERDESSSPGPWQQGGSLDIHGPSGQQALKEAGLFDEFNAVYARWNASKVRILRPSGETSICFGEDRNAPEIDRLQLRQLLLNSIPAHKIRWDHSVCRIERSDNDSSDGANGYIIHFINGNSATGFKLIVGADGGWSKVRPLVSAAQPVYCGKMYIESKISHNNRSYKAACELAGPGLMMAVGPNRSLAIQQSADGTYKMYFGITVAKDFYEHRNGGATKKSEAVRRLMLSSDEFYANWAPQLKAIVADGEGPFRAWSLHYLRPEEVDWDRGAAPGVTLLGDAAHLSTPFVGEGVNCAMYDAVLLVKRLVELCGENLDITSVPASKLEEALALYEKEMFERGRDLIRRSKKSEAMLFDENGENFLASMRGEREKLIYDGRTSTRT
ncbi:hypothetical protein N7509_003494 [Penicillium cosmopolitanum]|uniref:FAD-binding domain-containing protein n=1 Tax=Penicillium cosmopolitanum TaxID=1131564 RepID=A0A9W9W526_9EURO|nr:uncharacterized protein N7509_003494 [Penicillium cosmopolitanum]KAJ5403623.1 hypothetical protein N7509_003494 [Penicillium cosmopolitanum]